MDTVNLSRRQFFGAASSVTAAAAFLPHDAPASEDGPLGIRGDFPVVSKGRKPIPLDDMEKKADEVRGQFARLIRVTPDEKGFRLFTPPAGGSSIVSFHVGGNQARAREVLDKAGVHVSFRENGALVRVSPALFNTRADILRFLEIANTFV